MLLATLAGCAGLRGGGDGASAVYRLPYEDGTRVRVTRDHRTHQPPVRLDLVGTGAQTYRIVAAARGTVRYIVDEFSVRQDSRTTRTCNNNYIWLEHPNGEWTKYSHVQFNTVPNTLQVGDFVQAGTVLGTEGDVGFASGSHIHFEVGVPDFVDTSLPVTDPSYDPLGISPATCSVCSFPSDGDDDASLVDTGMQRQNRIPVFCQEGILEDGDVVTAQACNGICDSDTSDVTGTVADDQVAQWQGSGSITSDLQVDAGGGAAIKAATRVTLAPGFRAESGSSFVAAIGACDAPGF